MNITTPEELKEAQALHKGFVVLKQDEEISNDFVHLVMAVVPNKSNTSITIYDDDGNSEFLEVNVTLISNFSQKTRIQNNPSSVRRIYVNSGEVHLYLSNGVNNFQTIPNAAVGGLTSDQNEALLALRRTYNFVSNYNTTAGFPLTFDPGTIHAISILSVTGTFTFNFGSTLIVLAEGQNFNVEVTEAILNTIRLISTTGTFLVTTIR
jgi:hypothetical protein